MRAPAIGLIAPIAGGRSLRVIARRVAARAPQLLAVSLLLCGAPAHAQAAASGPDRLHVTAKQDPASRHRRSSPSPGPSVAGATRTQTAPRPTCTPGLSPSWRCHAPGSVRDPPGYFPYGDAITVTERRFSAELAIRDACLAGRKLRLCGYLTAQRRTTSVLRTVTVARDSTTVTVAVPGNSSGKRRRRADPRRDHGLDLRHLAHRRACASEAGCSTTPRPLPRATTGGVHVGRATCPHAPRPAAPAPSPTSPGRPPPAPRATPTLATAAPTAGRTPAAAGKATRRHPGRRRRDRRHLPRPPAEHP